MESYLAEAVFVLLGAYFGVLAFAFAIVTFRSWINGRSAYEANRELAFGFKKTLSGKMREGRRSSEKRAKHGLSINLKSGKLSPQQQLSAEAIDDVIGRRF